MLTTWAQTGAAARSHHPPELSRTPPFPQTDVNHAQCRHYRHGEEHPRNAAKLLASQYPEQDQHGMNLDAGTHQVRIEDVILKYAVHHQENDDPEKVRIP